MESFKGDGGRIGILDAIIEGQAWRLITAHLPHAECSDAVYEASLRTLQGQIPLPVDARLCAVGVDANAVVGKQTDSDDTRIIGSWGLGPRSDRGRLFANWAHDQRLSVINTMLQKSEEKQWTHEGKATHVRWQID